MIATEYAMKPNTTMVIFCVKDGCKHVTSFTVVSVMHMQVPFITFVSGTHMQVPFIHGDFSVNFFLLVHKISLVSLFVLLDD